MRQPLKILSVSAFLAVLPAQAPTAPLALPPGLPGGALHAVTPIHTAAADPAGGAYGTWAAGHAYKASFGGGMVFVPYLGRDYPVTRRVSWRTTSATLGGRDLLGAAPPRGAAPTDRRYEYRFGRLVEAYDVLAEGLEQTFVVAARGPGELRIEGAFGGNLEPVAAGLGAIEFRDGAGRTIVTYGAAVAIDALGRRFPVESVLAGDRLTHTVRAADVARARFPLVVDPLLATNLVSQHPIGEADSVDIARDDAGNIMAIAYVRHVSVADQDAWIHELDDDFTNAPGGDVVFTDLASWGVPNIRICNVGPAGDWVAVVNRAFPTVHLRYWSQQTGLGVLNPNVTAAANPGADNLWFADIGGVEAFDQSGAPANGTSAMCVYQRDDSAAQVPTDATTIWAQRVDVAGGGVALGAPFQISGAGNDHDFPSITKVSEGQDGGPACWIAVWQRYDSADPFAADWDVVGTQVFDDDTASGLFEADGAAANDTHRLGPKVEGQRGRYLVAFGALPRAGVGKHLALLGNRMDAQRFDWPSGGVAAPQPAKTFHGPGLEQQMIIADVAYDADVDSQWVVLDLDILDSYVRLHRFGYTGGLLVTEQVSVVPVQEVHNGLGGVCYDDDGNRYAVAYGVPSNGGNPIYGRYLTYPAPNPAGWTGSSCRPILPEWEGRDQNDVVIAANDQLIGNEFGHIVLDQAPPGALHFMLLSTVTADQLILHPAVEFGCKQLISTGAGYIGALPLAIGSSAEWNVPIPEPLPAFTLHAQDVFYDPATDRIYTSYRLSIPLAK